MRACSAGSTAGGKRLSALGCLALLFTRFGMSGTRRSMGERRLTRSMLRNVMDPDQARRYDLFTSMTIPKPAIKKVSPISLHSRTL